MEQDIVHIFKELRSLVLTRNEHVHMQKTVHAYMHAHPVRPLDSVPSPLSSTLFSSFQSFRFAGISLALALILTIGVSTSYAAEGALPGDPLYAFKVNVNEPIEGSLALSASSKVAWQVELANRRLAEAEKLAVKGELTPAVTAVAATQLAASTEHVAVAIAKLHKDSGDVVAVAAAQAQFETSLSAHAQVLTALTAAVPDSKEQIEPILATVETSVHAASKADAQAAGALAAADIKAALSASASASTATISAASTVTPSAGKADVVRGQGKDSPASTTSDTENSTAASSTHTGSDSSDIGTTSTIHIKLR